MGSLQEFAASRISEYPIFVKQGGATRQSALANPSSAIPGIIEYITVKIKYSTICFS